MHAQQTNKQTESRAGGGSYLPTYLPTYRRLLATTLVVPCPHALASGTLLPGTATCSDSRHGSSVRRLTLGHKGGCASARFKASPQVLGGSRQRVVESDRALDVITPTRERPRTLVWTYTCMHACMHACFHMYERMDVNTNVCTYACAAHG